MSWHLFLFITCLYSACQRVSWSKLCPLSVNLYGQVLLPSRKCINLSGIGSITPKIKALLFKWLSRNHEGWEDFISRKQYKPSFKNGLTLFTKRLSLIWSGIYTTINFGDHIFFPLRDNCKLPAGNGDCVHFWDDVWVGDHKPLSKLYTRLYCLSSHKMAFIWNRDTRSSDFACPSLTVWSTL